MSNKLEDLGKSYELAGIIEMMKPVIILMDLDYAKEMAEKLYEQGNWQDSAAALNLSYDPEKSNVLRLQGRALSKLVEYVELLKKIDSMKERVAANSENREQILKLFM